MPTLRTSLNRRLAPAVFLPRLFALCTLCALCAPSVALGQSASLDAARKHFELGQELFTRGQYVQAADEFVAAYTARPFPAFLYNAAVCHEKLRSYPKAVELLRRYLTDDPSTSDRAQVEKRIAVLEAEIRASLPPEPAPASETPAAPAREPTSQPAASQPASQAPPSPAIAELPAVKPKGLVVIESKPPGATIYLDDKKRSPVGKTPWNGSIEGEHAVILESRGYKSERKQVAPSSDKLLWIYMALSEEHYLGWLEVRANVGGADVYIDGRQGGAVGRTPFMGNVTPGRHRVLVSREGYSDVERDVVIQRGKAHELRVALKATPVGFVSVRGETVDGARVKLDGKQVCENAPCRFPSPEGTHKLAVMQGGKKTYHRTLDVQRTTETTVTVRLASKPSRSEAYWELFLAAGFGVGGYFLHDFAATKEGDLGKFLTYTSYGCFGLSALTAVSGVYDLFRDKGPSSSGTVETRSLAAGPAIAPGYAGLAAAWRW